MMHDMPDDFTWKRLEMAMDHLKQSIADFETLTRGLQPHGKHALLDLSEVCRQNFPLLQAAVPEGMVLEADFPAPGPVIHANAELIVQVLTNLVTNAWEAACGNPGAIGLTVKTVSRSDITSLKRFPLDWQPREIVYACLEVTDEGHGILYKDIDMIFDPLFTTKFTCLGMGLPEVLGIVCAYDGAITVESEPCWGTIFRIFLPASPEEILLGEK
jgi:two-component system, cell cycle sensor histidine kinase and response regulator CckA